MTMLLAYLHTRRWPQPFDVCLITVSLVSFVHCLFRKKPINPYVNLLYSAGSATLRPCSRPHPGLNLADRYGFQSSVLWKALESNLSLTNVHKSRNALIHRLHRVVLSEQMICNVSFFYLKVPLDIKRSVTYLSLSH